MPRGGKRVGAGAKPRTSSPTIVRGIRFTVDEWSTVVERAYLRSITPSEYIRRKALE
jgi:hypothetical protein